MGEHTYTLSEIAEHIENLPTLFEGDRTVVHVTQNGKRVMEILPIEVYEEYKELYDMLAPYIETVEILEDEELMAAFRQSVKDMEEGKVTPWEDVKKDHGWE